MTVPCMPLAVLLSSAGLGDAEVLERSPGAPCGEPALSHWTPGPEGGPKVVDLVMSSLEVTPGALFACVPGAHADGHDYATDAVERGAVGLVCERPLNVGVPQVVLPSVRRALGPLSAALWSFPSAHMNVVGVTGTNGKTTTCALLASIFRAGGWPSAVIGTLSGSRTTPEAPVLQRTLASFRDAGVVGVAMEVSSHALAQHRESGTEFAAAVFTNLSQDHLDYHGTMKAYFEAKAALFTRGHARLAVVNRADTWGAKLVDRLSSSGPPQATCSGLDRVVTYAPEDATQVVGLWADGVRRTSFVWRGDRLVLPMAGAFNVANAVAAATVAEELGLSREAVREGLASVPPVRGRFELIDEGQPFAVVVDYAHTPAALSEALGAARELATGAGEVAGGPGSLTRSPRGALRREAKVDAKVDAKVIVVFGAGGERDPGKRPLMGRIASRLADTVVVTSDNPRSEPPLSIIDQVLSGAEGHLVVEPERARAIERALHMARPGDVVLIAGKGHESGQDFGTHVEPFDDAEVSRAALRASFGGPRPAVEARGGAGGAEG